MPLLRYTTTGAHTFSGGEPDRCPHCKNPMHNGFQLTCEPGVCMFRDKPVRLAHEPLHRRAA